MSTGFLSSLKTDQVTNLYQVPSIAAVTAVVFIQAWLKKLVLEVGLESTARYFCQSYLIMAQICRMPQHCLAVPSPMLSVTKHPRYFVPAANTCGEADRRS